MRAPLAVLIRSTLGMAWRTQVNEGKFVDPRHAGAALETESRHPVRPEDPPQGFGRTQLIGLAVFMGVPVLIYLAARFL